MIENKIGLEFEFLLRNKKGDLVFPSKYGFEVDDFPIIGEARAEAGSSIEEALGNFFKAYYEVVKKAEKKNLTVDISGYTEITNEFNAKILKEMGTKTIAETKNLKGTEILECNDDVVKDGKVVGRLISTGFHIHFSSSLTQKLFAPIYKPVDLFWLKDKPPFTVYKKEGDEVLDTVNISRITMPVLKEIITYFDKKVLPKYELEVDLKYRMPGYYEIKSYGFEYRSLPFSQEVLDDIYEIVSEAFKKLEELKI